MQKTRKIERSNGGQNGMNADVFMEAQRSTTENTARMISAACDYTLSVQKAWLDYWKNRLPQYSELPKHLVDIQTGFVDQALDHYRQSLQQVGDLAQQATERASDAMEDSQMAVERAANQVQAKAEENAKENLAQAANRAREQQHRNNAHQNA